MLFVLQFNAYAEQFCTERELNLNGLSKHFYDIKYSKRNGWNERNYGIGFTCHLRGVGNWDDQLEVGVFKNSFRETSVYLAYGIYYPVNPAVSVGVRNFVASGYRHIDKTMLGPLPTIKFRLNQVVTLNLSVAPRKDTFIAANIGFRF